MHYEKSALLASREVVPRDRSWSIRKTGHLAILVAPVVSVLHFQEKMAIQIGMKLFTTDVEL